MIIFKSIRYKNFLSVGKKFNEIDFLKNKKKVFVGKNASGKSTIIDALTFALYNRSFRKTVKDLLVNTITKKHLEVEVEFSIGEKEFKIRRGVAPVFCELYIDGELKNMESNARDYQTFIENTILRMSEKTFRQIVVLGSSDYTPFLKCPAYIKREIVEDLLEISIFSNMNTVAKRKMNLALTEFNAATVKETLINNDIVNKTDVLDNLNTAVKPSVDEKNEILSQIKVIEDSLKVVKNDLDTKSNELLNVTSAIAAKKAEIKKIDALTSKIENNVDRADKTIKFLNENDNCEFCHQDIDHKFKHDSILLQDSKKAEFESGLESLATISEAASFEVTRLTNVSSELTNFIKDISTKEASIVTLQDKVDLLDKAAAEHSEINIEYKKSVEADLVLLRQKSLVLDDELAEIKKRENSLTYLTSIFKDDGIKSKIIMTYLPVINRLIRKYLDILDFDVDFRFNEFFEETIKSNLKDDFSYYNFSTGQQLRINLAILFTWRELSKLKNSAATNLIILDEIHSSTMDDQGVDAFNNIIDSCIEDSQTVIIITHSPETVGGIPAVVHTHQLINGITEVSLK